MPKPKYDKTISDSRRQAIAKAEGDLLDIAKSAGIGVYKNIIAVLSESLDIKNGVIVNSVKNLDTANSSTLVNSYFSRNYAPAINNLFDVTTGTINKEAIAYFGAIKPELKLDAIRKKAEALQMSAIGFGKPNGFLANLTNTQLVELAVKKSVINAIRTEQNFEDFRQGVDAVLNGNGTTNGVILNQIQTNAFDAFAQYDRSLYNQYASELELNYAIYQGGEINTTRPFCEERNGNVYNRETIADWDLLTWAGKKPNNNIFVDCGGYNCRHYLDWISYELAIQLDPEIEKSKYDA